MLYLKGIDFDLIIFYGIGDTNDIFSMLLFHMIFSTFVSEHFLHLMFVNVSRIGCTDTRSLTNCLLKIRAIICHDYLVLQSA